MSESDQSVTVICHALRRLPPQYRTLLTFQVLECRSVDEIARELALSRDEVSRGLATARRRLREMCGEDMSLDPPVDASQDLE